MLLQNYKNKIMLLPTPIFISMDVGVDERKKNKEKREKKND